jgi:hypothetical protein
MLNRDTPDTQQRLTALERRVSALETGAAARPSQPGTPVPGTMQGANYGTMQGVMPGSR